MEAIGTRPFSQLDNFNNKMIFLKGMLILSEVKVCYAQRAQVDKPDENLPAKRLYTEEELRDFNSMASTLPYPLAIWFESIGNAVDGRQIVTPLLAEIAGDENCSGAATFAPRQLLPLLKILRAGVPDSEGLHMISQALNAIPGFQWEQFEGPVVAPAPICPYNPFHKCLEHRLSIHMYKAHREEYMKDMDRK
jgi:hypothetical protein